MELEFTKLKFHVFFLIPRQTYIGRTSSVVKLILSWNSSLVNSSSKN